MRQLGVVVVGAALLACGGRGEPSDAELKLPLDPEPAAKAPPLPPPPPREPQAPERAPAAFVDFASKAAGAPATVTFRMGAGPRATLTGPAAEELVRVLARPSSYLDSGEPACTDDGLQVELAAGAATLAFVANCGRVFLLPDDRIQDALLSEAVGAVLLAAWSQSA